MSNSPEKMQEIQVRINLAIQLGKDKSVQELQEIFDWVMGPKTSILPVSKFEVVKQ